MKEAERLRAASLPPPIGSTRIPGEFVPNHNMSKVFKEYNTMNTNNNIQALTAKSYDEYKESLADKGATMSGDTRLSSEKFDPVKAAYEVKEGWENLTQKERIKEIQKIFPDADPSIVSEYAAKGFAGVVALSAIAGKMGWLTASGITTASAGAAAGAASAGAVALPLLAVGLFGSGQDIESINSKRVAETLEAMENAINKQAVSSLEIPSMDGLEYSKEDRLSMMEQDYTRRGVIANDAYTFNNATTVAAERREALSFAQDLRTSGGTITIVDKGNKKKVIKARDMNKELSKDEIKEIARLSDNDYKGHTAVNENFNYNPAYQFTKTIGDKTYYIDIPANTLKEDYSAFKNIFETINNGISEETIVSTPKGNYTVAPYIHNGTIQYGIMDGNNEVVTLDKFLEEARNSVGERYYNQGETRTERKGK